MLKWIGWDSFEFEKASRISKYSFPNPCEFYSRCYYAPFWCDLCNSSDHATNSCLYYACYAQHCLASPWDNTVVVISLHDSSFPLVQCIGLEAGELFKVVSRFDVAVACFKSEDILDEVHDLDEI